MAKRLCLLFWVRHNTEASDVTALRLPLTSVHCRDGITDNVAGVICRSVPSLGYIDGRVVALTASSKPPIGAASQPIWLGGITCNGKELGLQVRSGTRPGFGWATGKWGVHVLLGVMA